MMVPHGSSGRRTPSILLLNPNSSAAVTEAMASVAATVGSFAANVHVDQLDNGPEVIESPEDHSRVLPLILQRIQDSSNKFDAVIIGCHGDPGVIEGRQLNGPRVLGLGESSMLAACALGTTFGVITLGAGLVDRKWSQIERYKLRERCAGVEPSDTGVLHGLQQDPDIDPYLKAGRKLAGAGASAVILGCAGMAMIQSAVQAELGITVIEPVSATLGIVHGLFGGAL